MLWKGQREMDASFGAGAKSRALVVVSEELACHLGDESFRRLGLVFCSSRDYCAAAMCFPINRLSSWWVFSDTARRPRKGRL